MPTIEMKVTCHGHRYRKQFRARGRSNGARVLTKLKPDYVAIQRRCKDTRPPDHLIAHYELERRLADRLRAAPRDERSRLYSAVYSELFNSLPDHPQKATVGSRPDRMAKQVRPSRL